MSMRTIKVTGSDSMKQIAEAFKRGKDGVTLIGQRRKAMSIANTWGRKNATIVVAFGYVDIYFRRGGEANG